MKNKEQDPFLYEAQVFIWAFISLAFSKPRWDMNLAGAPAAINSRSTQGKGRPCWDAAEM